MFRLTIITLAFCIVSVALFHTSNYFGLTKTSLIVITLLTLSYLGIYLKEGLNAELAYWGLIYASFTMVILRIGLLQSHAGCHALLGDCYQDTLPSHLREFKLAIGFFVMGTNAITILVIARNIKNLFISSTQNNKGFV